MVLRHLHGGVEQYVGQQGDIPLTGVPALRRDVAQQRRDQGPEVVLLQDGGVDQDGGADQEQGGDTLSVHGQGSRGGY